LQWVAEEVVMVRMSSLAIAAVVLSAAALAAQVQTPAPTVDPASPAITVVGCVQEAVADGSLGGTPLGTSATPADAGVVANAQPPVGGFLLTGARPAGRSAATTPADRAATPTGTAGTKAAEPSSKDELKTYALEGNANEFATHKGRRVEITGTLAPPVSSGRNRPAGAGADPFQTGVQRLQVQTLMVVSQTCEG
jgi:hypothetical protein